MQHRYNASFLFVLLLLVSSWQVHAQSSLTNDNPVSDDYITGPEIPELSVFDDAVQELFSRITDLPGLSLAVEHEGRLVYARGFGVADADNDIVTRPKYRYRIASITKPIVSVAIFSLVEDGLLELDDKLFDIIELSDLHTAFNDDEEEWIDDSRVFDITIEKLLVHLGGWDRNVTPDPFFNNIEQIANEMDVPSPPDTEITLLHTLAQELDFEPGDSWAYSNIGYALLGTVIENVTGQPYDQYISELLSLTGIGSVEEGKTRGTLFNEVSYYTNKSDRRSIFDDDNSFVPRPYGSSFYLEGTGASAALISTAPDLLKFTAALNSETQRQQLLLPESAEKMLSKPEYFEQFEKGKAAFSSPYAPGETPLFLADDPETESYYSYGWVVFEMGENRLIYHDGSLPGTSTFLLISEEQNLSFAVLTNVRFGFGTDLNNQFQLLKQNLLIQAAMSLDSVEIPDHDFFAPMQLLPEDGHLSDESTIAFSWEENSSTDNYRVQIATDSTFEETWLDTDTLQTAELEVTLDESKTYYWRVGSVVSGETLDWSPGRMVETGTGTGIAGQDRPQQVSLHQNYPNPFNPVTVIKYQLPESRPVMLEVFDMLGRRVALLADETLPAGTHQASFDASGLSSGLYLYRLTAGESIKTRKMMLIK